MRRVAAGAVVGCVLLVSGCGEQSIISDKSLQAHGVTVLWWWMVRVAATTADVIHSFWVPQLNRKIDMVPGMHNRVLLYSSRTGVFRGQCSQFCGFQHAHMSMYVFVQSRAAFRSWLNNMSRPAARPASAMARAGQKLFMSAQCASCHQIRGTPAQATVGPDLTHLNNRTTLASPTIRNER